MGIFTYHRVQRIFGLDLLRFLAIFCVLYGHSVILLPEKYKVSARVFVQDGVALFFVLSGFLIGQIIFKHVQQGRVAWKDLLEFWKRRWFRTVPAYVVVLLSVLLLTSFLAPSKLPENAWVYFVFCQNILHEVPSFFQESWSLSVEEWFYLFIPPILFLLSRKFLSGKSLVFVLLLLLLVIFFVRWFLSLQIDASEREGILLAVIPRLDGILIGVLLAFVKSFYAELWEVLKMKKTFFISLSVFAVVLIILMQFHDSDSDLWFVLWSPLLKSLGVALLLPYLTSWESEGRSPLTKFITFSSIISYSMYLLNRTIIIDFIIKKGIYHENGAHQAGAYWYLDIILFWGLTYGLSYLLFRLIETPFLNLRELRK